MIIAAVIGVRVFDFRDVTVLNFFTGSAFSILYILRYRRKSKKELPNIMKTPIPTPIKTFVLFRIGLRLLNSSPYFFRAGNNQNFPFKQNPSKDTIRTILRMLFG